MTWAQLSPEGRAIRAGLDILRHEQASILECNCKLDGDGNPIRCTLNRSAAYWLRKVERAILLGEQALEAGERRHRRQVRACQCRFIAMLVALACGVVIIAQVLS